MFYFVNDCIYICKEESLECDGGAIMNDTLQCLNLVVVDRRFKLEKMKLRLIKLNRIFLK